MDITKHQEFFDPTEVKAPIHIIGCGAIGSFIAEMLTRLGITNLELYDFDVVEEHNITNQLYNIKDLYKTKLDALTKHLLDINPAANPVLHDDGWKPGTDLSGYVFLAVDSIVPRQQITEEAIINKKVLAIFDFRMRLTDAQHYAAINELSELRRLLKTMDFTDEEAKAETPVSACNTALSISPTIRTIVSYGVTNFINYLKGRGLKKFIQVDTFEYILDVFA
jgi:molybdopterin/thiamine biosynthesis adenylyltransferase